MTQLIIKDLNFCDDLSAEEHKVQGGLYVPRVSSSLDVGVDVATQVGVGVNISVRGLNFSYSGGYTAANGYGFAVARSFSLGGYTDAYAYAQTGAS
ncbi:MAG: hypothetical protein RIG63_29420 [Coleofasciculus chthonoplastes F3-SA18-01]|uniref:hypothetical protein n=1 Tax=Coleofasciculus chthonoplastes TaxID=64178 RepID=UPI0032F6CEB9